MTAKTLARLPLAAAALATLGGCNLLPGVPELGDPENLARIEARFKTTITAELPATAQPDWGDRNFSHNFRGPNVVVFCGRSRNAPPPLARPRSKPSGSSRFMCNRAMLEGRMNSLFYDVRVGTDDLCAGPDDHRVRASDNGQVLVAIVHR